MITLTSCTALVCLSALVGRYELERGPGHIKLTARLAVSPFGSTSAAELAAAAEAALEATRQAVLGPEAAAAGGVLDAVLLHWLDYEMGSATECAVLVAGGAVLRAVRSLRMACGNSAGSLRGS
jgi:hypothetical protein